MSMKCYRYKHAFNAKKIRHQVFVQNRSLLLFGNISNCMTIYTGLFHTNLVLTINRPTRTWRPFCWSTKCRHCITKAMFHVCCLDYGMSHALIWHTHHLIVLQLSVGKMFIHLYAGPKFHNLYIIISIVAGKNTICWVLMHFNTNWYIASQNLFKNITANLNSSLTLHIHSAMIIIAQFKGCMLDWADNCTEAIVVTSHTCTPLNALYKANWCFPYMVALSQCNNYCSPNCTRVHHVFICTWAYNLFYFSHSKSPIEANWMRA